MKISRRIFLFLLVVILCNSSIAQTLWKDPMKETFAVLEGRLFEAMNYSRFPDEMQAKVRDKVWDLSRNSTGLSILFQTDAPEIKVEYLVSGRLQMPHMPTTGVSGLDLYAKGVDQKWDWVRGGYSFGDTLRYTFKLDRSARAYEEFRLFLPLYNSVKELKIGVDAPYQLQLLPAETYSPIIVYGTSIAQGACASRPAMAWTSVLRRALDQPVVNLGFSGNGWLEKDIIEFIAETDAKLFVLDCLPNLGPGTGLSDEEIRNRIQFAVKHFKEKHPNTPVLLTQHAGYSDGEVDPMRKEIYLHLNKLLDQEYQAMLKSGMNGVYQLTQGEIGLGEADFVDGTHPTDGGMLKYGQAYVNKIREIFGEN